MNFRTWPEAWCCFLTFLPQRVLVTRLEKVRNHWRQQYYSATKQHRSVWIMPHTKGLGGRPLKVAMKKVCAVVR